MTNGEAAPDVRVHGEVGHPSVGETDGAKKLVLVCFGAEALDCPHIVYPWAYYKTNLKVPVNLSWMSLLFAKFNSRDQGLRLYSP